jgi:hypothetical protein
VDALLAHPAVQAGAAPFAAGLAVALLLHPLRLGGLAAAAGFFVALYLAGRLDFHQRMVMAAATAPLLGALTDVAFRPTRSAGVVLGIVFGLAAFWVYLRILGQKPPQELVLYALGITALTALTVAFAVLSYAEPTRAGAAGVALGAALGVASWVFSWRFDHSGFALAAACGGFLLLAMVLGKATAPGASFTLSSGVIASLLAADAVLSGRLPWHAAAALPLVPLAARLPMPLVTSSLAAAGVCAIAWLARRGG